MSRSDFSFQSLPSALRSAMHEWVKQHVRTAMPGTIESYDPSTGRATVQPSLDYVRRGGGTSRRPLAIDVPVLMPGSGQWIIAIPIARGDLAWLMWSERGLAEWKKADYGRANSGIAFDASSCVAMPYADMSSVTSADPNAICIQRSSGMPAIAIGENGVKIFGNLQVTGTVADNV